MATVKTPGYEKKQERLRNWFYDDLINFPQTVISCSQWMIRARKSAGGTFTVTGNNIIMAKQYPEDTCLWKTALIG